MKLTVLVDNNTYIDNYYFGEPGLSFYLETENKKILFDTGYSNIFLKNAEKLSIDLSKIDTLVLSHGHNDHTGGLQYLKDFDLSNVTLIAHKGVFLERYHCGLSIGSPTKLEELKVKEFIDTKDIVKIDDNLYFLGPIDRVTNFESKGIGTLANGNIDYLYDDSALVYKSKEGLFIISACSHSGICNIIEYAKKKLNENNIVGIIGGFHLLEDNEQLEETIKYFKEHNIDNLYPSHCVCLNAKFKMSEIAKVHEVGVGLKLDIE